MQKISRKRFGWLKNKHYELWDWLSKNPDKEKEDWFALDKNKGIKVANDCFACQFANEIAGCCCRACPLICDETNNKSCLGGLYEKYANAKGDYYIRKTSSSRDKIIELAKQIRDLPWSEEYVEDEEMNNENYIVINGKKAELTEEQLKQLGIEVGKDKRERVKVGDVFFFVDRSNHIDYCVDSRAVRSNYCYDTHNYFKTKEEAEEYAEVLEIKRQLMKFADEHNGADSSQRKWFITYHTNSLDGIALSSAANTRNAETIYFSSKEIARQAIDEIGKGNIIKYLTYNY